MNNDQLATNSVPHGWKHDVMALLIIAAMWLVFFWPLFTPIAAQRVQLEPGDFTLQFLTFRQLGLNELRQGRWPLWLPCIDSGYPYFADPQAASFYPPTIINWGVHLFTGTPTFSIEALELEAALHVLLAAVTAYGFLRGEVRSRLAALIGALAFSFGGYLLSYPMLQLAILETAAWLPAILWALRRVTTRGDVRSVILAGLLFAMCALAGHPQTLVMIAYVAVAYFVFCVWRTRLHLRRVILLLGATGVLALLLSAIQLLPTLEFMRLSSRAELTVDTAGTGFPFSDVAQFIAPGSISRYSPLYIGLLPLALAVFAIGTASVSCARTLSMRLAQTSMSGPPAAPDESGWKPRLRGGVNVARRFIAGQTTHRGTASSPNRVTHSQPERSARILFWSCVAVVALLISFGNRTPLFEALYTFAPGFRLFRDQERHALIVVWALSLLAAYGSDVLFQSVSQSMRRWLPIAALIIVAIDLAANTRSVNWVPAYDPFPAQAALTAIKADAAAGTPVANAPAANPDFRLHNEQRLLGHAACMAGLNEVGGITPIHIAAYQDFIKQVPREVRWQILNVRYVVTWRSALDGHLGQPIDSTLLQQQGEGKDATYVYRLAEDHPRAWIVHEVAVKADRTSIYAALGEPEFNVRRTALTQSPIEVVPNQALEPISITRLDPDHITAEATLTTPGLLVLSEVNYPGWTAAVNGVEQSVIEVDGAIRGVVLGTGQSHVDMTFQPMSLQVGGGASVLALLICVGGWIGSRRRRRD